MSGWTRRPSFWIAYALAALCALGVAAVLFPSAIPLVNLDIRMSRHEAIAKAGDVASRLRLVSVGARVAADFGNDGDLQNYVELEAGGKRAFAALVAGDRYAPYWWSVRLFRPGQVEEATIRFRPDGTPSGFVRRVAEDYVRDPATPSLTADAARVLAERLAASDWGIDFTRYRLLQQSQETRASGRVDHQFVYEEPQPIGEARIRLRLAVAGDELTQLVPYAQIPESFARRYQEMRSANELIAGVAAATAVLLYGVGGCIVAVLWLLRERWLVWRPALAAGFTVSALLAAAFAASYPARWMSFDTANDATLFWFQHVAGVVAVLAGGGLALALVFMAAESLSRRAFPRHPQLWKLWTREAGASVQTLGRTIGGYLFVGLELGFVVAFYFATNRYFGWWQPSEALTDPDILASGIPALSPIAMALQAGFMEECLFRAVPLSLGALLGARFGHRAAGIGIALVLQAVVFGAAHANYPGFPAYSRLVELVLPALVWGLVFLRFGLLPTIVLHALFDLALMSIPIFLVDAPGAIAQRGIVVLAGALPLLVVAWRRWQRGAFVELPEALRNRAWQPRVAVQRPAIPLSDRDSRWRSSVRRALPALALAGLILAAFSWHRGTDAPRLSISRADAIAAAESALAARGVTPGSAWRRSADIVLSGDDTPHLFVYREAGAARYRELVGSVLAPPVWEVRFATFEGDVVDRAEEWRVSVDGSGHVRVVHHALPESREGARLSRDEALAIAARAVRAELGIDVSELTPIAAQDQARPARTDWTFVWRDARVDVGKGGEARLRASVQGDEPTNIGRYVHVPETWSREERQRRERLTIARGGAGIAVVIATLGALVLGILAWSRGHSDRRASFAVAILLAVLGIARAALGVPQFVFSLSTTEPVASQIAMRLVADLLRVLALALVGGLLAGVGAWWARSVSRPRAAGSLPPWLAGIAAAFAIAGVASLASSLLPDSSPSWPAYAFEDSASPVLAAAVQMLGLPAVVGVMLFALAALSHFTVDGSRRRWMLPALLALVLGAQALDTTAFAPFGIAAAMLTGVVAALVIDAVVRFDPRSVPAFVATVALLAALDAALAKDSGQGYAMFVVQAACGVLAAWVCSLHLAKPLAGESVSDVLARPAADS